MTVALTLSNAYGDVSIYISRIVMKTYLQAMRGLFASDADRFECDLNGLPKFMHMITKRLSKEACNTSEVVILIIPRDPANLVNI